MNPSKSFIYNLNRLDKDLFVKFNDEKDRFIVYRKDRKSKPRKVLTVSENDRFTYPNDTHIEILYKSDTWRNKKWLEKIDEDNEEIRKRAREYTDRVGEMCVNRLIRTQYL